MADPDSPAADSLPDSLESLLLSNAGEQGRDNVPSLSGAGHSSSGEQGRDNVPSLSAGHPRSGEHGRHNVPSLSAGHWSSYATSHASSSQPLISLVRPFVPARRVSDFGGSSSTIGGLPAAGFLGSSQASSSRGPLPQQVLPLPNASSGLVFGSADFATLNYLPQQRSSALWSWSSNGSGAPFVANGAYQIPVDPLAPQQTLGFPNLRLGLSYGSSGDYHHAQSSDMREGGNPYVGNGLSAPWSHLSSDRLFHRYEASPSLASLGRTQTRSRRDRYSVSLGRVRELVRVGPLDPRLAVAPHLSHLLLRLLDDGDLEITSNILGGVLGPSVYGVMTNQYGRRLFRKLLDVCNLAQIREVVLAVTTSEPLMGLVEVAKHTDGISCVEKLITAVKPWDPLCSAVTWALGRGADQIMTHPIASSLVNHCFRHLRPEHNMFLIYTAIKHWYVVAMDQHGILCLQLCIENSSPPFRLLILEQIVNNTLELSCNNYGNYAVQFALELEDQYTTKTICTIVAGNLVALSLDKHATYVIEKCLKSSAGEYLLQELVRLDCQELEQIARDCYGNYVLITALKVRQDPRVHDQLVFAIQQISCNLEGDMYGQNVVRCINQLTSRKSCIK